MVPPGKKICQYLTHTLTGSAKRLWVLDYAILWYYPAQKYPYIPAHRAHHTEDTIVRIAFLIGPGGSGKGTQAKLLMVEALARTGHRVGWTEMSAQLKVDPTCKAIMDRGELCSDDVVCDFFDRTLATIDSDTWLADGFPRTVGQARHALALADQGHEVLFVVFDIQPEVAAVRCGERYRGPDDEPEAVCKRIAKFKEQTEPALNLLRDFAPTAYTTIDANQAPDAVFVQFRSIFNI